MASLSIQSIDEQLAALLQQRAAADMSEFDQFGAVYDGAFDRNACYDRPALR